MEPGKQMEALNAQRRLGFWSLKQMEGRQTRRGVGSWSLKQMEALNAQMRWIMEPEADRAERAVRWANSGTATSPGEAFWKVLEEYKQGDPIGTEYNPHQPLIYLKVLEQVYVEDSSSLDALREMEMEASTDCDWSSGELVDKLTGGSCDSAAIFDSSEQLYDEAVASILLVLALAAILLFGMVVVMWQLLGAEGLGEGVVGPSEKPVERLGTILRLLVSGAARGGVNDEAAVASSSPPGLIGKRGTEAQGLVAQLVQALQHASVPGLLRGCPGEEVESLLIAVCDEAEAVTGVPLQPVRAGMTRARQTLSSLCRHANYLEDSLTGSALPPQPLFSIPALE
ncbi:hypothetical protein CYMTET_51996 [Cymbomonas tetramitiformis]|uniref:Uncharacterized protein n=1 Tax=Cymbomonas tetramitiformis TaxID=36881 RepID=A0AAE0BL26_9CHLO|nr:hypothetical protein CYMTET_51996 [Cymbomonas tetramitiformis]